MPGIVLLDDLTVLGDGDLINRLITIIPRPAGALQNTVGTIGQTLGGTLTVLADGNNVSFGVLGLVVTASGFEIRSKRGTFFRLLGPRDGIQRVLGQLNLAVNYGVADCQGKAFLGVGVMVVAGFQLVYGFVQLVAAGRFRFLEGVNPIIGCTREQVCCECPILYRVGGNGFSGFV